MSVKDAIAVRVADINVMEDIERLHDLWQEAFDFAWRQMHQHDARHFARDRIVQVTEAPDLEDRWHGNGRRGQFLPQIGFLGEIRPQHAIQVEPDDILLVACAEGEGASDGTTLDWDNISHGRIKLVMQQCQHGCI